MRKLAYAVFAAIVVYVSMNMAHDAQRFAYEIKAIKHVAMQVN
jgi:hypothetical protein